MSESVGAISGGSGSSAVRLSVVIPSYNRCGLLREALLALDGQTVDDFEVIVVDDGSTDGTRPMLRRMLDATSMDLTIVENETNLGANPSRNRGIELARGSLIAFLDSDSIPEPEWAARIRAPFEEASVASVTGGVDDPEPRSWSDLTYRGTHRLPGPGPARRLAGCNMCVRADLLRRHMLDADMNQHRLDASGRPSAAVSSGCDEEGIYLRLKAEGHRQVVEPSARVLHVHHYTFRTLWKQAWRGGRSAAQLVYKYHLPHRVDMVPFLAGYLSLPLGLLHPWLWAVPVAAFGLALAAITYNDLFLKGKTVMQTVVTFPLLLVYYQVRLAGYVWETVLLRARGSSIERVRLVRRGAA